MFSSSRIVMALGAKDGVAMVVDSGVENRMGDWDGCDRCECWIKSENLSNQVPKENRVSWIKVNKSFWLIYVLETDRNGGKGQK